MERYAPFPLEGQEVIKMDQLEKYTENHQEKSRRDTPHFISALHILGLEEVEALVPS